MDRKYLTTKDVCKKYSVTPKTIWKWKRDLKMPYLSFGKSDYFIAEELLTWEKNFKYNTVKV